MFGLDALFSGEVDNIRRLTNLKPHCDEDAAHTIQGFVRLDEDEHEHVSVTHNGIAQLIPIQGIKLNIKQSGSAQWEDEQQNALYIQKKNIESPTAKWIELSCYLSEQKWSEFCAALQNGNEKFYLSFRLKSDATNVSEDGLMISIKAYGISITLVQALAAGNRNPRRQPSPHLRQLLDADFTDTSNSLRRRIGNELALSLSSDELSKYESEEALSEALYKLHSAFHSSWEMKDYPEFLFSKYLEDFLDAIKDLPEEKKKMLVASRDAVWVHASIRGVIDSGEEKLPLGVKLLEPQPEEIEELAYIYCKNPHMVSPLLEWAIIDSLIYIETMAFARHQAATNPLWLRAGRDESMKPVGPLRLLQNSLWQSFKMLFNEGLALFATYVAAKAVGSESDIGFWVAFGAITVIRWLRPKKNLQLESQQKALQLLSDMANAHNRLKTFDFNAGLLKTLLYSLETRGAVFSNAIYNVLDKRLKRECIL